MTTLERAFALENLLLKVEVQCQVLDNLDEYAETLKILRWCLPQAKRELKKAMEVTNDGEGDISDYGGTLDPPSPPG